MIFGSSAWALKQDCSVGILTQPLSGNYVQVP